MKPIVIRQREAYAAAALSLVVLGFVIYAVSQGVRSWAVWACLAIGVLCLAVSIVCANHTDTFSKDGITMVGMFGKRTIPWSNVIQAGAYLMAFPRSGRGKWYSKRLGLTFKGGHPMRRSENPLCWALRNMRTCVDASYSEDLEELVRKCYGPLDFDLSDGQSEQSIVVD